MKVRLVVLCLLAALLAPAALVAQYTTEEPAAASEAGAAPAASEAAGAEKKAAPKPAQKSTPKPAAAKEAEVLPEAAPGWLKGILNMVVKLLTYVGNIFGDATGIRIGGATISAIVAVVVARVIKDNVPWWVQGLLYGTGGTMLASGGVDVAQLVQQFLK